MLAMFGLLRRSCYCGLSQLKTTCKLFSNHPRSSYRAGLASSDFLSALSHLVLICDFLLSPTSCVARTAPPICGAPLRCRRRAGADVTGAREKPLFPNRCCEGDLRDRGGGAGCVVGRAKAPDGVSPRVSVQAIGRPLQPPYPHHQRASNNPLAEAGWRASDL